MLPMSLYLFSQDKKVFDREFCAVAECKMLISLHVGSPVKVNMYQQCTSSSICWRNKITVDCSSSSSSFFFFFSSLRVDVSDEQALVFLPLGTFKNIN